jgi:hypothetical protein
MYINCDRKLPMGLFRHPDVQVQAVLADRHVKSGIAVELLFVKGIPGIAELDTLAAIMIRVEHALPCLGRLGFAPAAFPYGSLGIGNALINGTALAGHTL